MSFQGKMISLQMLLITLLLLDVSGTARAQELTIYVDNWPPYNFIKDDKIVGISTELIEAALHRANIRYKLEIYPFKRALMTVQKTPNTMLFTVARIPQREDMFAWIGPLHPRRVYLFKLSKNDHIKINNLEDIKKYHTGVLAGGSVEQFFITNGFPEDTYYPVSKSLQLLKMLLQERIELIPGDPLDLAYQMKHLGYKASDIEIAFLLSEEGGYYVIANKDTSAEILSRMQESLNEILATGARDRIIQKYME